MRVVFFDVGQGDAALLSFPDGSNWLVDGGNSLNGYDAGDRHILPYLRWAGIGYLNGIILTHPNSDHYGGLVAENPEEGDFQDTTWRIYVISPRIGLESGEGSLDTNEVSLVLLVQYGKTKVLMTGDIGAERERRLVDRYGDFLDSDILTSFSPRIQIFLRG